MQKKLRQDEICSQRHDTAGLEDYIGSLISRTRLKCWLHGPNINNQQFTQKSI